MQLSLDPDAAAEYRNPRTNDSAQVVGVFPDVGSAYDAAAARANAVIYRECPGDFGCKMVDREDWRGD